MTRLSLKKIVLLSTIFFLTFSLALIVILFKLNQQSISHDFLKSSFQKPNHHLAVIVPFRERLNQLLHFIPHMKSFLDRQNVSHEFLIINQVDNYRFNRGALINVGYKLSQQNNTTLKTTYIAMHDVDLLPLNDQLSYRFPEKGPFHVSSPTLHPKYHYKTYVGGILLIRNEHFELVNGFSTNYFGWGLEDDEFYARIKEANLMVYRPENILTDTKTTFIHLHDENIYQRDYAKLYNQSKVTRKRDRKTGLNSTRFHLLHIHNLTLQDVPFKIYDVALYCDLQKTPWCQTPQPKQKRVSSLKVISSLSTAASKK